EISRRVDLGLHHEQQHQELVLTDIKYNFAQNPLLPLYKSGTPPADQEPAPLRFLSQPGGEYAIGHASDGGFAHDNEQPRHPVLLAPFAISNRLVTNGEYLEFMLDGGYKRPELWLADGWERVQSQDWRQPLYWLLRGSEYQEYGLHGPCPLNPRWPVTHVS